MAAGRLKVFVLVPQILEQIVKVVAFSELQVVERIQEHSVQTAKKAVKIPAVDVPVLCSDQFQQSKWFELKVSQIQFIDDFWTVLGQGRCARCCATTVAWFDGAENCGGPAVALHRRSSASLS